MARYEQGLQNLPENLGSYFRLEEDGIAFVDPLYGERLDAWPRVLEHDPISKTGREYLQGVSHQLSVVHATHGSQEDFSDITREHGDVLKAAAVIAIEADWDPAYIDDFSNPNIVRMPGGRRESFMRPQIEWAHNQGKLVMPYDLDGPDDPLRRSLLALLKGNIDPDVIPFPTDIPLEERAALAQKLCMGAYTCMRQPMLLGQIGFGLSMLVRGGYIESDAKVVATLGIGHYPNFVNKVHASGILSPENVTSLTIAQPTRTGVPVAPYIHS